MDPRKIYVCPLCGCRMTNEQAVREQCPNIWCDSNSSDKLEKYEKDEEKKDV